MKQTAEALIYAAYARIPTSEKQAREEISMALSILDSERKHARGKEAWLIGCCILTGVLIGLALN